MCCVCGVFNRTVKARALFTMIITFVGVNVMTRIFLLPNDLRKNRLLGRGPGWEEEEGWGWGVGSGDGDGASRNTEGN